MTKHYEDQTEEDVEFEMDTGDLDEDVYTEEGRDKLIEDDEISTEEEGFMEGAEGLGRNAKCANCGKVLIEEDEVVELELDDDLVWFCCDKCAERYKKKHDL